MEAKIAFKFCDSEDTKTAERASGGGKLAGKGLLLQEDVNVEGVRRRANGGNDRVQLHRGLDSLNELPGLKSGPGRPLEGPRGGPDGQTDLISSSASSVKKISFHLQHEERFVKSNLRNDSSLSLSLSSVFLSFLPLSLSLLNGFRRESKCVTLAKFELGINLSLEES